MIVRQWLDARTPAPPAALRARLDEVLGDKLDDDAAAVADLCIAAAERLLRDVLARSSTGRDIALDLLTADALATYAFEAAADVPATIWRLADDAMSRFAALAPKASS